METKMVIELVKVARWTCQVDGHSHRTREVAERCIKKNKNRGAVKRRWTVNMIADVCMTVVDGTPYRTVGEHYGLSLSRIRQVYQKGIRMMLRAGLDEPFPNHDVKSIEEVREHADFWNRRIAKFRALQRESNEHG